MKFTDEQNDYLEETFKRYNISTPLRKVHFMATCHHESMGFKKFVENLNYSAAALVAIFPKYFTNLPTAKLFARQPEKIANRIYANRMGNGNSLSGDGWKHKGAGAIQLTGKDNQTNYFKSKGLSVLPNLLHTFEFAVDSAGWFWQTNKLNSLADADNVTAIRKRVNGGFIGLADVRKLVDEYKTIYL